MNEMSNRLVSIVIVTAGKNNYIESCLNSVTAQTYPKLEITTIDNSVNRNFGQDILRRYPNINLYQSQKNLFYCQALNKGIEISKGDFILCLNDDVILDKKFIEEALKGFEINERIGMVSGKILRRNREIIDSTGLFLSIWRTAKERGYGQKDSGRYEKSGYIFGVTGAVAFYRRKMLKEIKLEKDYFDPEFRIFYEDLDIAWCAQNRGWKGFYVPEAIAYHTRGGTVRGGVGIGRGFGRRYLSDELQIDLLKNRYLTIIRNENPLSFLLHLPFIILYDIFALGYILLFRPRLVKKLFFLLTIITLAFRKRKILRR